MEEKVQIERFFHEHPFIPSENVGDIDCYVCGGRVENGERAYICLEGQNCSIRPTLHQRCGELGRQIVHPSHPDHPLHLADFRHIRYHACNLCRRHFGDEFGYRCHRCDFDLDIRCGKLNKDELFGPARPLLHPTHHHPLVPFRKLQSFVFNCDACNTEERDVAYTCATCDLLIHESCALLPLLFATNRHHHRLSLSFCFPYQHRRFKYECSVCGQDFDMSSWLYYCGDCRYFAHIKCAMSPTVPPQDESILNYEETNGDGYRLVKFPLQACDISKELITPFVIREVGTIPNLKDLPLSIKSPAATSTHSLSFNYHKHSLSLVLGFEEETTIDDDDDDDDSWEVKMKICDVCVSPISSPPYYECAPCKYFVHSICYSLPETILSKIYGKCPSTQENHKLVARHTSLDDSVSSSSCDFCKKCTSGMFYECEDCWMTIDVKCASLEANVEHSFHPNHKLVKTALPEELQYSPSFTCNCCELFFSDIAYLCTKKGCNFKLDTGCVLLPQSVAKREHDKHPLLLTCDAYLNHPSDFYCDICEEEMHPKSWMYHCRLCDNSFHIDCFKTDSGEFSNIKFGQQIEIKSLHPHRLTFNCVVNLKLKCCERVKYRSLNRLGFECASCYYAVCKDCGIEELESI